LNDLAKGDALIGRRTGQVGVIAGKEEVALIAVHAQQPKDPRAKQRTRPRVQ
jgi:hypothetical protein